MTTIKNILGTFSYFLPLKTIETLIVIIAHITMNRSFLPPQALSKNSILVRRHSLTYSAFSTTSSFPYCGQRL